jgi:hypothetical protein
MKQLSLLSTCILTLCLIPSCSPNPPLELSPQVRVVFQPVSDPVRELCTDDTLNRTDYINVPLVRFVGSTIELNGTPSSAGELLDWARKKYKNTAEQALWVQVSPEDRPIAEHALMPLVQAWPRLDLRLVDPSFTTCRKQRTGK